MAVKNPPAGFEGVTPYLTVGSADEAIAWYRKALGAELVYRMEWNGRVGHAELKLGGGCVMLADEFPDMEGVSPATLGGTTVSLLVYVRDVDSAFATALAAGARQLHPVDLKPWGDRSGQIIDPYGHRWTLATHVEDVSFEEVDKRLAGG